MAQKEAVASGRVLPVPPQNSLLSAGEPHPQATQVPRVHIVQTDYNLF